MTSITQQSGPTVGGVAIAALRRFPERIAFSWDENATGRGTLTYRGALELIGRYQAVLSNQGLTRGKTAAILGGNRAESWCVGTAAASLGLAVTWLHPLGSLPDHLFQLADSGADVLIVDERNFDPRGKELAVACADLDIQVLSIADSDFATDLLTMGQRHGTARAIDLAAPNDIANIGYTGGTTGTPKGVVRTHTANVQVTQAILSGFELPSTPKFLAVAPISHVGGSKVLPTLICGGTVHLVTGFSPDKVLATIERERLNYTLLVPTMIYALLDAPALDTTDLSTLELILYGASPISPSRLSEGVNRIGPVFSQMFGQTECYPISLLRKADHDATRPELLESCGFPLPGVAVSIRDEDGHEVGDGDRGELCVRSGGAMNRYWGRDELTAETVVDGWLRTGDVARADERGYLYIVDRKKDLIITGGFNVYPREVEDALATHDAVSAAAVYGVADDRWGESVTATVVLRPGVRVEPEALIAHVRSLKGSAATPKRITIAHAMPMTGVGKIDKRALRASAGGQSARH